MSMHPPPDPDELASDLVDGLLPADEAARLRNDPGIAARVAAIEAARAALRMPPPAAPGAVDKALAATFTALDADADAGAPVEAGEPTQAPPPVTHLRSVGGPGSPPPLRPPSHSTPRRSSGGGWLAAAAVIVLLGLVTVALLSKSGSDGDADTASADSSAEAHNESGGGDAATGAGGSAENDAEAPPATETPNAAAVPDDSDDDQSGGTATTTTVPPTGPTSARVVDDLGAVSNADDLAAQVRATRSPGQGPPNYEGDGSLDSGEVLSGATPGAEGSSGCPGLTAAGDPARGTVVYAAQATYRGSPVVVHLYDPGSGDLRLVATDRSCTDVVDVSYTG